MNTVYIDMIRYQDVGRQLNTANAVRHRAYSRMD